MQLTRASAEQHDKAVIEALLAQDGVIHAHSLPRIPGHYSMCNTDMCNAIQRLGKQGIILERLDSGGSPKWGLKEVKR